MSTQAPARKRPPFSLRLPVDVEALLPQVAEAEKAKSAHAYGVDVLADRVRDDAKRHGITLA